MRGILLGLLASACVAGSAMAADFASSYAVAGSSPGGGGAYKGKVSVKRTGDGVYQVVWTIGGDKFVGTGIGGPEGLAVGYKSGSDTGIAIYRVTPGGEVEGVWTYQGGTQIGKENWTPN
ncbi:hypothetical protein IHQ68_00745 [Chelatococcus sambhunathii]|uniref:Fibronectin-binding protein n=1 Tax=Chelatococcus sambhunathii TaxID=363953 RepID=A0ABU1DAM0_9HYPH|nr:hypothetical protein [Chelatococcus sambhunathii]MDR4305156.1 hypothetical protein [Chelatococcus sambhunathii]